MVNMKLLTIIIPMYNVSKYINQCLDSLTENESVLDDLEIIVVNDGSTDDSGIKAQVYVDKYPQSVLLINKKNGGHGSAINVGVKIASGKYFRILDADDYVLNEGIERQVDYIRNQQQGNEVDLIMNPSNNVWENGKENKLIDFINLKKYDDTIDISVLAVNRYTPFIWNATYRTGLYRENNIRPVDEGISFDDIGFNIFVMPYLKTVRYLPDIICQYRLGIEGQSNNPDIKIKKQWMLEKEIEEGFEYRNVGGPAQILIEERLIKEIASTFNTYLLWKNMCQSKKTCREMLSRYKELPIETTENKKLRLMIKTKFFGFYTMSIYFKMKTKRMWG